jgi:hypothetical protein
MNQPRPAFRLVVRVTLMIVMLAAVIVMIQHSNSPFVYGGF